MFSIFIFTFDLLIYFHFPFSSWWTCSVYDTRWLQISLNVARTNWHLHCVCCQISPEIIYLHKRLPCGYRFRCWVSLIWDWPSRLSGIEFKRHAFQWSLRSWRPDLIFPQQVRFVVIWRPTRNCFLHSILTDIFWKRQLLVWFRFRATRMSVFGKTVWLAYHLATT